MTSLTQLTESLFAVVLPSDARAIVIESSMEGEELTYRVEGRKQYLQFQSGKWEILGCVEKDKVDWDALKHVEFGHFDAEGKYCFSYETVARSLLASKELFWVNPCGDNINEYVRKNFPYSDTKIFDEDKCNLVTELMGEYNRLQSKCLSPEQKILILHKLG